ncbi:MAG TPA: phosphatase PAP2 family protein [Gemmatimonadaceae bacterium]|nr:phosphatase PAP2 family protein [Gemmatimonadaceae bacterium]
MDRRPALVVLLVLVIVARAGAQTHLGPERQDLNDLRGDVWSVWTAPAHADGRAVVPTLAAAGISALSAFGDSAVYAWMAQHPDVLVMRALRPLREDWKLPMYEFGSGQYLLPLSGLLYAAGRLSHDGSLRDAGLGCAAGHLSSAGLRQVFYVTVSRARPRVTPNPFHVAFPGRRDWDWHSFLSGHVANSMACASFFAHRYALGIAEPAMYLYVAAVGLGRMADGRHWTSDTVAGAILGFSIGKAIADRQRRRHGAPSGGGARPNVPVMIWSIRF